jgi:hypothetical protein
MARKLKVFIEGEEIPGLVRFGEVALENGIIDVPTFNRIVKIHNGITTMPEVPVSYETRRNTKTRQFLRDWYNNKEVKDMTIVQVDATGQAFEKVLWSDVECRRLSEPEVDFANPTYARIDVTLLPFDIQPVAP